jgi:hypothetical protein
LLATATSPILQRSVYELALQSTQSYPSPFADVTLDAVFTGPSGQPITVPGFYDGDQIWRVRINPNEAGQWRYRTHEPWLCARHARPGLGLSLRIR